MSSSFSFFLIPVLVFFGSFDDPGQSPHFKILNLIIFAKSSFSYEVTFLGPGHLGMDIFGGHSTTSTVTYNDTFWLVRTEQDTI